jgi:large subunit ribosomal protein L30
LQDSEARLRKKFSDKEGTEMAGKLKVTLAKSTIGSSPKQRKIVEALGLRKTNKSVELPDNPQMRGAIEKVKHLLKVEEI